MSYILDALRRANAERERGSVPTLLSDPGPADRAGDDEDELTPRRAPWLAASLAAVLVVLGALWLWPRQSEPEPVVALPQPAPVSASLPAQVPAPVVQQPVPVATVPLTVPPRVEAPRQAQPSQPAPQKAESAPANRPVPGKAELPEDIRKQLPALVTNGAMYSDTPANRMVIINGQVLHEGDKLAPDLVLEQIMLKGAVLSFKGQRFSIGY